MSIKKLAINLRVFESRRNAAFFLFVLFDVYQLNTSFSFLEVGIQ